jgi:hypothetical protein
MAATVGSMRLTTRSLFVPKILVNALLIKEFLWAHSRIWAHSLFYAIRTPRSLPAQIRKNGRQADKRQAAREKRISQNLINSLLGLCPVDVEQPTEPSVALP